MVYSRSPSPRRRERDRDRDRRKRGRSRERGERRRRSPDVRERGADRAAPERDRERGERNERGGGVAGGDREFSRHRRSFSRSRSRSPRSTSRSKNGKASAAEKPVVSDKDLEGKSPEEIEMMKMMGFCSFDSTKGKQVLEKDPGAVHVILKRKYRQYMNRKGGFNRPLDFVA